MYRNIKNYDLRYTDVDSYDILKPSALLGLLQESAGFSADELGFGYDVIKERDLGFILSGWYVELFRPIRYGDKLSVHTWPVKAKNIIFLRDYELYVGDEKSGVATSRWCLMDVKKFALCPISVLFSADEADRWNTERSIDFNKWKIPPAGQGEMVYSLDIGYSDYDHYFHVNNTKYADFLLDCFTADDFRGKYIKKLQISYVKQCKLGEKLCFYRQYGQDGYIVEGRSDGETRVAMRAVIDEI